MLAASGAEEGVSVEQDEGGATYTQATEPKPGRRVQSTPPSSGQPPHASMLVCVSMHSKPELEMEHAVWDAGQRWERRAWMLRRARAAPDGTTVV